ncbi:MAG: GNAT family N-acetyltransferase [Nitrospinae bacterium]|nr:GNAT family N-acetyltransferase [Nitrospinota bacterium]
MEWWFRWNRLYLYALTLEEYISPINPKEEVEFVFILSGESAARLGDLFQVMRKKVALKRLERGDVACVAYWRGRIIAYCWAAFKRAEIGEIDRTLLLREGECYLYDAYTLEGFRGKGLYPAILGCILRYVKGKGFGRALIFALKSNQPSHHGIRRVGFRLFQVITYIRWLGFPLCFYGRLRGGEKGIQLVKCECKEGPC